MAVRVRDRAANDLNAASGWLSGWLSANWKTDGPFTRSWPISATALWIAALLSVYVFVYYL